MDRNEVMRLIGEAGWSGIYTQWTSLTTREGITVPVTIEQIERAFELVAAREREACAKVCDGKKYMVLQPLRTYTAQDVCDSQKTSAKFLAKAIRARGEQKERGE